MVVAHRQHQRDETAQYQSQDLDLAQSFGPAPSGCSVAVACSPSPDLREDVHGGHVEEGSGGEEHGHAGGVNVWQRFFAALEKRRKEKTFRGNLTTISFTQTQ